MVAWASKQAAAAVGIGKVGIPAEIVRVSGADESAYPPSLGDETTFAATVMWSAYSARDRDGTQITARDVQALVAPDAETEPRNGDRLRVDGRTFDVVNVQAVQPGGVVLLWKCQARAADG